MRLPHRCNVIPVVAFVVAGAICALAASGCSSMSKSGNESTDAARGQALNTTCPMMDEVVDEEVVVEYNGNTIAFCCEGCIDDWNALSDAERDAKVAQMTN